MEVQLKCYDTKPNTKVDTDSDIRKYCLKIVDYAYFDTFIMTIILLNALALSCVWIDINPVIAINVEELQEIFNYIFILEMILKIIAYQKFYFYNGWNIFDFIVVSFVSF